MVAWLDANEISQGQHLSVTSIHLARGNFQLHDSRGRMPVNKTCLLTPNRATEWNVKQHRYRSYQPWWFEHLRNHVVRAVSI